MPDGHRKRLSTKVLRLICLVGKETVKDVVGKSVKVVFKHGNLSNMSSLAVKC